MLRGVESRELLHCFSKHLPWLFAKDDWKLKIIYFLASLLEIIIFFNNCQWKHFMLPLLIQWPNPLPPIFFIIGSYRLPTHRRDAHRIFSLIHSYFKIKIWVKVDLWVRLGSKGLNTPSNIYSTLFSNDFSVFLSWDI